MIGKTIKVGTGLVVAMAAGMLAFPSSAFADYAPTSNDVVGVGSDTLQHMVDFVADGDFTGNLGYNSAGNKNKFISIDATADVNTRLAYGPQGLGPNCAPGNGGTPGTGNQNVQHTDAPCTLNPTVMLRAGRSGALRPNGSGAGYNLLKADTNGSGLGLGYVDFSRASSARGSNVLFDSVQVGTEPFAMMSSATSNAVALSASQLLAIYQCTATTWNDPLIGGSSSATIVPLTPQIGSGTRDSFLKAINGGTTFTPGSCAKDVEENDPEAIDASPSPINAIEPMSGARLNLFVGKLGDGTSNGVGGFFKDPSCPFPPAESTTPTGCLTANATLAPNVKYWTTGTPSSGTLFNITRPMYIYFRHNEINSTKKFQPGGSLNWIRTMLYNPCPTPGGPTCVIVGGVEYGPGGAPYVATAAGQANVSAAGFTPVYAYTAAGP
jgi:ABC-type phosphate transport system substrate-binding protein